MKKLYMILLLVIALAMLACFIVGEIIDNSALRIISAVLFVVFDLIIFFVEVFRPAPKPEGKIK